MRSGPPSRCQNNTSTGTGDRTTSASKAAASISRTPTASPNRAAAFPAASRTSGLWKAVERELNLSLVWFLRIRKGVAGISSPWDATLPPTNWVEVETERGGKVNLNRQAGFGSGKLLGLMLGDVRFMMLAAYDNGVLADVEALGRGSLGPFSAFQGETMPYLLGPSGRGMPWDGSLPWLLKKVGDIRNRHAHVEAMRRSVFQQLEDLVLAPRGDPWSWQLGRILSVKRRVLEYVDNRRRGLV